MAVDKKKHENILHGITRCASLHASKPIKPSRKAHQNYFTKHWTSILWNGHVIMTAITAYHIYLQYMELHAFNWSIQILGDQEGIIATHLIIKSEVSIFPVVAILPWQCVWCGRIIVFCLLLRRVPMKLFFRYYCTVYAVCKQLGTLHKVIFVWLHIISLSWLYRLIWKHWKYKKGLSSIISRVCVHSLNYLLSSICGCVSSAYPFIFWLSWEYVYLILLS